MSSIPFLPLREKPSISTYKQGDLLVLFGELFSRGYANGLVEEAEARQMTLVRSTVGRREKDHTLRALLPEEQPTGPFINIPLEAGFDFEKNSQEMSPVDLLKECKLTDWMAFQLPPSSWEDSREQGRKRFRQNVQAYVTELEKIWKPGQNVLFAHLMAGGVPRAKIVMPLMNRAFKGTGERYISSEQFWKSDIGQLCASSFLEVTAYTFRELIEQTKAFREKVEKHQGRVSYLAYGYHGTEILIDGKYQWQTYTPYLQGWAKMELENISQEFFKQGISSCVYNCPEILTNSSSIFQGVEISLYPLVFSLMKNSSSQETVQKCKALLKDEISWEQVQKTLNQFFTAPEIREHCVFEKWPQHSRQKQLEKMIETSELLYSFHKDEKNLMTAILSEVVFEACGKIMLHNSWKPQNSAAWIGHDIISKIQ